MKSVLISTRPNWCEKICRKIGEENGIPVYLKPVEVRKSAPKGVPFNAYLYCTNGRFDITDIDFVTSESVRVVSEGRGKVIGEFVCDKVDKIVLTARGYTINNDIAYTNKVARESCLYFDDLQKYLGKNVGYAWHISDLKIYDEPRELGEFYTICNKYGDDSCGDCPYLAVEQCSFPCDDCVDTWCGVGNIKPLTRAPQSWCYVDELQ